MGDNYTSKVVNAKAAWADIAGPGILLLVTMLLDLKS